MYATKTVIIELTMTLSFLGFLWGEILNYTGKEGVIVFLYSKNLETFENSVLR